jgi:hemerythrin superfamily protein
MQRHDGLKELVADSLKEHNAMKALLQEMGTLSDREDFEDKLEELIDNVEHHAEDEEEGKMFPKVRELVSASELQKLGAQLQAAKGHRKAS